MKIEPLFEIDRSTIPHSCLPADLDRTNLIDITKIGEQWRCYLDTKTGKIHDGTQYFALSQNPE